MTAEQWYPNPSLFPSDFPGGMLAYDRTGLPSVCDVLCYIQPITALIMASLVAQLVKNPHAMRENRNNPWVGKIPRRRAWQPTPVFLPGESQGWGSLLGCHLQGRTESDTTEATQHSRAQHSIYCFQDDYTNQSALEQGNAYLMSLSSALNIMNFIILAVS